MTATSGGHGIQYDDEVSRVCHRSVSAYNNWIGFVGKYCDLGWFDGDCVTYNNKSHGVLITTDRWNEVSATQWNFLPGFATLANGGYGIFAEAPALPSGQTQPANCSMTLGAFIGVLGSANKLGFFGASARSGYPINDVRVENCHTDADHADGAQPIIYLNTFGYGHTIKNNWFEHAMYGVFATPNNEQVHVASNYMQDIKGTEFTLLRLIPQSSVTRSIVMDEAFPGPAQR